MLSTIQNIDFYILDFLQTMARSSFLDQFFAHYTSLGDPVMFICYAAILLIIKNTRRDGIMVSCGMLTGLLIGNGIIKHLVHRSRPCWLRPEVQLLIKNPSDYSFPSGHTMTITIFSIILIYNHPKLAYGLIPAALLLAYSRMYLYVHFPSDVLAGLLLGGLIGCATCYFFPKAEAKWKKRAEKKLAS
ncbi:MAG: phosphatase PAP2 family protein [Clostridiales bacterium]|nr:phosphatase PAP2 family protein [Clostridiales bacterium]